jgi:hypothetical protein
MSLSCVLGLTSLAPTSYASAWTGACPLFNLPRPSQEPVWTPAKVAVWCWKRMIDISAAGHGGLGQIGRDRPGRQRWAASTLTQENTHACTVKEIEGWWTVTSLPHAATISFARVITVCLTSRKVSSALMVALMVTVSPTLSPSASRLANHLMTLPASSRSE